MAGGVNLLAPRLSGTGRFAGVQNAFNAGELSGEMEGRTDLAKYTSACRKCRNFVPRVTGPARKRPGLRYVKEVKNSANTTHLIPFEFSDEQAYVLEFGDLYFRVYKDSALVTETAKAITGLTNASPRVVTIVAHGYANGDEVYITGTSTELDGRYFIVANQAANTFELAGTTAGTAWAAGGTAARVYTVTTPYATADVGAIQWVQSADTLYLAHPSYAPQKVTRTGHAAWTIATIAFDWPPFRAENTTTTTLYASAATGAGITITASAATFVAGDVGRVIKFRELVGSKHPTWIVNITMRWNGSVVAVGDTCQYNGNVYELQDKHGFTTCGSSPPIHTEPGEENSDADWDWIYRHSGEGYVTITAFTDSTHVTATVTQRLPASVVGTANATKQWSFGAWDATSLYPRAVTFFEDRLWWAGTDADPQGLWGSVLGDYENHRVLPTDASGLFFVLSDDEVNVIEWLKGGKALAIGTASGPFIGTGADPDKPISPSNTLKAPKHTDDAAESGVGPVVIGPVMVYAQRGGRRLREITYDFASDSYATQDLMLLADHLLADGGIVRMAWQQEPDRVLWVVTSDGRLLGMTYERAQDVVGWHRHPVGGVFGSGEAVVESIALIPHPDGDQDQLWAIVKHTINSATARYVEVMEKPHRKGDAIADAFYLDSALTYSGGAVTTLTGLRHLIGEAVYVNNGGAVEGPFTVSATGTISPVTSTTKAQVGLRYTATLAPEAPEVGMGDGSAQGKIQRVSGFQVRVHETGSGLYHGPNETDMDPVPWTQDQDPTGAALTLFSGDSRQLSHRGGYDTRSFVVLQHRNPLPCNVLAVMARFAVGGS